MYYSQLEIPGCVDTINFVEWEWAASYVKWAGTYKAKEEKTACHMEMVCIDQIFIWHLTSGIPGAKSCKTNVNNSSLLNSIRCGNWPTWKPDFSISGHNLWQFYLLANGI